MTITEVLYVCQHGSTRRGYATPCANCDRLDLVDCVWRPETDEERDERQRRAVQNGEPAAHLEVGR